MCFIHDILGFDNNLSKMYGIVGLSILKSPRCALCVCVFVSVCVKVFFAHATLDFPWHLYVFCI